VIPSWSVTVRWFGENKRVEYRYKRQRIAEVSFCEFYDSERERDRQADIQKYNKRTLCWILSFISNQQRDCRMRVIWWHSWCDHLTTTKTYPLYSLSLASTFYMLLLSKLPYIDLLERYYLTNLCSVLHAASWNSLWLSDLCRFPRHFTQFTSLSQKRYNNEIKPSFSCKR